MSLLFKYIDVFIKKDHWEKNFYSLVSNLDFNF